MILSLDEIAQFRGAVLPMARLFPVALCVGIAARRAGYFAAIALFLAWSVALVPAGFGANIGSGAEFFAWFVRELAVGMTMGVSAVVALAAFDFAGSIVGTAGAQEVDPSQKAERIHSTFWSLLAITLFFSLGGDLLLIKALVRSYEVVPIAQLSGKHPLSLESTLDRLRRIGELFSLALIFAAPVWIAMALTDIVLLTSSRIAPALHGAAPPVRALAHGLATLAAIPVATISLRTALDRLLT